MHVKSCKIECRPTDLKDNDFDFTLNVMIDLQLRAYRDITVLAANGSRLLLRGLVKRPGKARLNQLSNSTLEFHQTTYQKPYAIWQIQYGTKSYQA